MSVTPVTFLLLVAFIIALAPLVLAYRRARLISTIGWAYGVAMLILVVSQTGILPRSLPILRVTSSGNGGNLPPARCAEIMTLLDQQHVVLNRSDPARLVVSQTLWNQLPQEVKEAIVGCAEAIRPAGTHATPVQVIEQPSS